MKKKTETPLQGYLSSIVAFIIATTVGMMVFSIASYHAADQLAQKKLTSNISRQSIHFEERGLFFKFFQKFRKKYLHTFDFYSIVYSCQRECWNWQTG